MRLTVLRPFANPRTGSVRRHGNVLPGDAIEVDAVYGRDLIDAGLAEAAQEPKTTTRTKA